MVTVKSLELLVKKMEQKWGESALCRLEEVKRGSVGLKCWGCLKLCPLCNPHLVTAACDTGLKSKPFSSSLSLLCVHSHRHDSKPTPSIHHSPRTHVRTHPHTLPLSLPTRLCCSETVLASLWRLDLDSRTWHSLTGCSLPTCGADITCSVRHPFEVCVCVGTSCCACY